jgi:hypothetical protein
MQKVIGKEFGDLSRDLHAGLVPVGTAWELALASDRELTLHDKDGHHPRPAGTYLAACVFYATIYGKSPEGLPGRSSGLNDTAVRRLQAVAWEAVRQSSE